MFGFGEDTKLWRRTLHKWSVSYILQNGYKSDTVTLGRRCSQDNHLFVIAGEIASEFIRNSKNIVTGWIL